MQSRFVVPVALLALAACAGGGGSSAPVPAAAPPLAAPTDPPAAAQALAASAVTPRFTLDRSGYAPPASRSVTVALVAVNGAAPAGAARSVTSNLAGCSSAGCTIDGPPVPAGKDAFAFAVYDAPDGRGNVLARATQTLAVVAGKPASGLVAPRGVPASFALQNLPGASAGVPFAGPQPVRVVVKDAAGNPITGPYAVTVWLDDLDSSGATAFAASGADAPPAGQLLSSADTVALAYDGLAIGPATLMVSALNATTLSAAFAPAPGAIAYQGPTVQGKPEIDLFAAAGSGSSATFSVAEPGWSSAPFGRPFSVSLGAGCAKVATVSPARGTAFTVRAAAAPAAGSCTLTVADGLGRSRAVTVTYATTVLSAG